jgi:predicted anti-sigma-YlaC factor YlaD
MNDRPSHWMTSRLTCHDVTERASDYLDDRLPIMTKVRVGLHLVSCGDCSAYVKQVALVRDAVAMLPKGLPPPITHLRLRQHFSFCHALSR